MPRTSVEQPWDRVRFTGPVHPVGAQELVGTAQSTTTGTEELPAPGPWAAALVRSAVETLLGARPAAQLARWLSLELYERLARRAGLAVRVQGRPRAARPTTIRRVHVCPVREGVVEATVVLHDGQRVRAAAVRLEAHRGRWRATALEIG
ncbi:Rv3235 family protein [Georgenia sp. 10Sc9-8]|uniref:Rv3235 family protein n=1 Tax=Georgenia halotolerans TaxID=3028317 RepID=A0ABT5U006_9MICO|nr:Rv3235 family protein [Georgenia halotolerans]